MATLGRIEITQPLRRVIRNDGTGAWLHAMYNDVSVVELDDGNIALWKSKDMRFVEPYSKDTIYEVRGE